jgi:hypothetical protein
VGRRQWRLVGGVWCVRGRKCALCRRTGASGVKRDCGVGSPSGSTVAAREAEEVEACKSRARSTRARMLNLGGSLGE